MTAAFKIFVKCPIIFRAQAEHVAFANTESSDPHSRCETMQRRFPCSGPGKMAPPQTGRPQPDARQCRIPAGDRDDLRPVTRRDIQPGGSRAGAPIGESAFRCDHLAEMPPRRLAEREDAVVVSRSRDLEQEGRSTAGAQASLAAQSEAGPGITSPNSHRRPRDCDPSRRMPHRTRGRRRRRRTLPSGRAAAGVSSP